MSNLDVIQELCGICDLQNRIIKAQSDALAQLDAAVMEEEIAEASRRLSFMIGAEEVPDDAPDN